MQKQKTIKKECAILPLFECSCNKKYKSLSSLSNHIKYKHNNQQEEFRVERGVTQGRAKKLNKYYKVFLQKLFTEYYDENLEYSQEETREIFQENVNLVSQIVKDYSVSKQLKDQILKENIKWQPFWKKIRRQNIQLVMNKCFLSFLVSASKQKIKIPQKYLKDEVFESLLNSLQQDEEELSINNLKQEKNIIQEQIKQEIL